MVLNSQIKRLNLNETFVKSKHSSFSTNDRNECVRDSGSSNDSTSAVLNCGAGSGHIECHSCTDQVKWICGSGRCHSFSYTESSDQIKLSKQTEGLKSDVYLRTLQPQTFDCVLWMGAMHCSDSSHAKRKKEGTRMSSILFVQIEKPTFL
jgi:hypothetical protein